MSNIGKFLGGIFLAICFGFMGLMVGDNFINFGSILMVLVSLHFLVLGYFLYGGDKNEHSSIF